MATQREQVVQTAEKYVSRGKIMLAISEYRKLLTDNPNDINTLNRIGDLYARIQRIDEAVDFFTQVAEQYSKEGLFVKAIAIYKKVIKIDPTRLEVYEKLADLYHRQGLTDQARTQYQVLADYYQKHDDITSAITIYRKMADLEPENPSYQVKLIQLYNRHGLINEARTHCQLLADYYERNDNVASAIAIYKKLDDMEPNNPSYQAKLVSLQEQLSRTSDHAVTSTAPPPTQLVTDERPDTSSSKSTQPSPQTVPQKEARGKSKSSRDYAAEIEKLSQTFLRRKAITAPSNPSAFSAAKEKTRTTHQTEGPRASRGGIFICYRRSDSMDVAGRMHDRLIAHYSRDLVFKDVDSIPLGVDFRKHLENAMTQASIVIVVIGKYWQRGEEASGTESTNLLTNYRDFVRIEIELALRLNLPIIPVLVRGAKMPSEKDLPESLADLAYRNGMELRPDPYFHKDMDRLIAGMDALLKAIIPSGH